MHREDVADEWERETWFAETSSHWAVVSLRTGLVGVTIGRFVERVGEPTVEVFQQRTREERRNAIENGATALSFSVLANCRHVSSFRTGWTAAGRAGRRASWRRRRNDDGTAAAAFEQRLC
jgi:hypothetical protein